jgi:ribosomal protein L13
MSDPVEAKAPEENKEAGDQVPVIPAEELTFRGDAEKKKPEVLVHNTHPSLLRMKQNIQLKARNKKK